jgi:hypothetical protein
VFYVRASKKASGSYSPSTVERTACDDRSRAAEGVFAGFGY